VASASIFDHTKRLVVVAITAVAIACGGGSSSPTSPSAQPPSGGLFTGFWSGSFGPGGVTPMTLTLTQNGSTVSGTKVITCAGCGPGRSTVAGTASGQVATVSFTTPPATTPSTQGATLTLNGSTMTTQWIGGGGAVITGTLTASTPPVPVPVLNPSPTPQPSGTTPYDGVYEFSVDALPSPPTTRPQIIPAFVVIRNGVISSTDGTMAGQVYAQHVVEFTWFCNLRGNTTADYRGHIIVSGQTGSNIGEGMYTCRDGADVPPGGVTWGLRQVGR